MKLTRMEAYLASLPSGLGSHAEHVQKASVYRELTAGVKLVEHAAELPAELAALVLRPMPVSSWVPEVHVSALLLAMVDIHFSEAAFLQHMYAANRALLSGAVYGFLFRLLGPGNILKGARSRWGQLHRGMTMDVLGNSGDGRDAHVQISFPAGMVPNLLLRSYSEAFRAALEVAGGSQVTVDLMSDVAGCATFAARWR